MHEGMPVAVEGVGEEFMVKGNEVLVPERLQVANPASPLVQTHHIDELDQPVSVAVEPALKPHTTKRELCGVLGAEFVFGKISKNR